MGEIHWDLLIQNNGSKQEYAITGLTDLSLNSLYYHFEKIDMDRYPAGEYTYALIFNNRTDVTYEFSDVLMNTIVHTGEGDVLLRQLNPERGLLKLFPEEIKPNSEFKRNNRDYEYYKR